MKNKKFNLDKEIKNNFNSRIKKLEDKIKSKKFINESKKGCKDSFCNPTCKGTIFKNGEFPKELEKKYSKKKDGKYTLDLIKSIRNSLFDGKKTILKDNFYTGLKGVKKLKKDGAISGCAIMAL